jgi:hypothetical protein
MCIKKPNYYTRQGFLLSSCDGKLALLRNCQLAVRHFYVKFEKVLQPLGVVLKLPQKMNVSGAIHSFSSPPHRTSLGIPLKMGRLLSSPPLQHNVLHITNVLILNGMPR